MGADATTEATAHTDARDPDFVQSLARGLSVLTTFSAEHPSLTLADAARLTGLSRPTARRVLLTLASLGYVRHDGRSFRPTARVLDIGYAYLAASDLPSLVEAELEALAHRLEESCSVSVLEGADVMYVARVPSSRIMTISLGIGSRLPAYCTSMGRVLLAGLPPDDARALLEATDRTALTDRTVTDLDALCAELDQVRAQGFALVDQELEQGVRSVSAPLRDRRGQVIAAMNVGTHASRVPDDVLRQELLPELLAAAGRVSAALAKR